MAVETNVEAITALIAPMVLVLSRVSGVVLGLPTLVTEMAPMGLRVGVILAMTAVMAPVAPDVSHIGSGLGWALAILGELGLGAALGLVVRITLAAAELGAEVAGTQLGFGFSQTVDPLSNENAGALTRLVAMLAAVLLFATEGYHSILRALASSFVVVPSSLAMGERGWFSWAGRLVDASAHMFEASLRIALPLVGVGLATQLTFGLLTKVAPQLNLWGIGFLVSMAAGLVALSVFAPTIIGEIRELANVGLGGVF